MPDAARPIVTRPDPDGPDVVLVMQLQDGYRRAAAPGSPARHSAEKKWLTAYLQFKAANGGREP